MNIIAVTSSKGGTGKSCVAAFTGQSLAHSEKKVLLVEMGLAVRSLDLILGTGEEIFFDFSDIASGRCEPLEAVIPASSQPNIFLIPGSPFSESERLKADTLQKIIAQCSEEYDYMILDGVDFSSLPPSIVDTILLVVTPDSLSSRAAAIHAAELYGAGAKNLRLVINNVPPQIQPIDGVKDFDDLIDQTGAQLIAVIPQSPKLHYAANHALPLNEDTMTHQVFERLAARLMGKHKPLLIR